MQKKGKNVDPKQVERRMAGYSEAVTAGLLDETFGRWDSRTDKFHLPFLDRGDHIIIGGRTATELLMDKFNAEFGTLKDSTGKPWRSDQRANAYGTFREQQGAQYINQIITSALANGEKVEVFVPDKTTGRIQDQPMNLTPTGYEPAGPLVKPKQLTGWQKFWNKLGFYKKEKAAVVNYEKEMAARQKVQFCNKAGRANLHSNYGLAPAYQEEVDRYHPEIREDMAKNFPHAKGDPAKLGQANGFKTSRSSFQTIVMDVLATKRDKDGKLLYTNEQLFDMADPKMQKARADAAKEVYDHYKPGALLEAERGKQQAMEAKGEKYQIDPELEKAAAEAQDWLVDIQHDSATVLRERISQQAGKLDFSQPDLTEQKGYREFALLSDTAFDQSQDMNATEKRMDERHGKGAYWEAAGKVGDCSQVYRHFGQSLNAQRYLANDIPGRYEDAVCGQLAIVFKGQAFQQEIGKHMQEQPTAKFADITNIDLVMTATDVENQASYDDNAMEEHREYGTALPELMEKNLGLAREQIRDPEKFSRQITGGVFERRLRLQELSGNEKAPTKFEIRDAATVEREMQRQPQKSGGGPEI